MSKDPFDHLDDDLFERFGDLIERTTGISFDRRKREILRLHLKERAKASGCVDFTEYYSLLHSAPGEEEIRRLSNKIVVHQTEFFRNRPQFEALEQIVLPDLLSAADTSGRTLKIWSAGCSSGEEPYSIAMVVARTLGHQLPYWNVEILGTDISEPILKRAQSARYTSKAAKSVPEPYKSLYLKELADGSYEVVSDIRDLVRFKVHNLVHDEPPSELLPGAQLVFCRNVTIYFSEKSLVRAIKNMESALLPGGYLFLGHSESLLGIEHSFELLDLAATFAYRKPRPKVSAIPVGYAARDEKRAVPGSTRLPPAPPIDRPSPVRPPAPDGAHIKETVASAQGFLEKGDPESARRLVEDELRRHPTDAALHFLHGSALHVLGDDEAACRAFGKAIYCDTRFSLAYFYRAVVQEESGNLEAASRDYSAAMRFLESDPPGKWDPYLEAMNHVQLVDVCRQKLERLEKTLEGAR